MVFFGCETKLYEAKNTENTENIVPKNENTENQIIFYRSGLKKQPDIQGCLDEGKTKEINY